MSVRLSISVCLACHQFLFAVKNWVECNRRMMGPWIWNLPIGMTFPFELCQDVGAKDQESPLNKQQASKTFWGIRHPSHHWIMVINSEQSIKPFPLCGMHSSTANQSVAVVQGSREHWSRVSSFHCPCWIPILTPSLQFYSLLFSYVLIISLKNQLSLL